MISHHIVMSYYSDDVIMVIMSSLISTVHEGLVLNKAVLTDCRMDVIRW